MSYVLIVFIMTNNLYICNWQSKYKYDIDQGKWSHLRINILVHNIFLIKQLNNF